MSCCEPGIMKGRELLSVSTAARLSGISLPRGVTPMFVSHLLLHITSVDLHANVVT
jgi:hypothetical protein